MTNPALLRNLELNRNHPQAAGLELAIPVVDGRYRDYVRHRRLTPTTGGTLSPAINSNAAIYKGLYSDGATTATFYTIADTPMLDVGTGNFCVMCRVVFYSLSGNNREIVGKGADNAGGIRYKINYTITGGNEFTGEIDDDTTKTVLASGVSASTNTPYHLALRRVGNRYDFFVNGVSQANATHTHNTLDNAHVFIVNNFVSATTPTYYTDRILDGVTNDVRLYKTIVPDDQMIFDIYANSWELYAPPRRVVFISLGTVYNQGAAGVLTPAGAIVKTGIASKAGTLTPTGVPVKQTTKTFTGALTPSGVLAAIKTAVLSLAGSLTPTGAIARQAGKPAVGSLTPTGATIKATFKTLAGSLTPSGVLSAIRTVVVSLSGAITPTGAMTRSTLKGLSGAITPTGTAAKSVYKFFVGTLAGAGALLRGFISGSAVKCDVELTAAVVTNLALTAAVVNNVTLTTAAATNLSLTASTR